MEPRRLTTSGLVTLVAILTGFLLAVPGYAQDRSGAQDARAAQDARVAQDTSEALRRLEAAREHVGQWPVHSTERPAPPAVEGAMPVITPPPSDAVVLFDGTDLSAWEGAEGDAAEWNIEEGYLEAAPGAGNIQTREGFGDVQLHVEWAAPAEVEGESQERGNSGVFLMGERYEVQVLDSYENETYADGQTAAVYGQYPPLVNASRPPGTWQSYDIIFRRPHFDDEGAVVEPARMTIFHNGVLVQDHVVLTGPTAYQERPSYEAHAARLPIALQDHGDRVRFRNIWLRELEADAPR